MERIAGVRNSINLAAMDSSQSPSTWILLLVGVVTFVVAAVSHRSRRKKIANLPPGPRNWPVIGALPEMEPNLHKVLDKFATKYGPVVHFRLGVQTLVVVSSSEAAEELLKHKDAEFSDRLTAMNRSAAKYCGIDGMVFPFSNYGADLKLHRKFFITELSTTAKMKTYEKLRTQEMAVMVEQILSVIRCCRGSSNSEDNDCTSIGIRFTVMAMIRNVLFSLCFGRRFDDLPSTDILREFLHLSDLQLKIFMDVNVVDLFPWLTWLDPQGMLKKMKVFYKEHTRWYERIFESNRKDMEQKREPGFSKDGEKGSFVQTLLLAQEQGTNITDKGMMASIDAFLTAGIDTSSSQTEWVLLELVRHPKVSQRLQDEIDAVLGKERPLEETDLQAMPFLNAVILESLRLHGVVPFSFPHVNLKPSTLCGYNIPANTAVLLNSYTIGRDPKGWKDPAQFNPDRFMAGGSSESIKANGLYYNLLSFSSGRRACPGYNLGILMISRTVGTLVHAFNWSPPTGCLPEDLSIDEEGPFILHPTPDVYLVPTPRLSSHVYKSNITSVKLV